MSGVEIKVRADARQATREIHKVKGAFKSLEERADHLSTSFNKMALALTAVFAGGVITKSLIKASDSMTSMANRVNLVTKNTQKTNIVMRQLFEISARSRGSIDAAAETFNRFGLALADSNKPLSELLIVTEAVQKATVISGSSAESAKAALVQLGQGLASGQLRGQELNSVLEQTPRLARAIADGMGIPFGKLREEAMAGMLTADAVYDAILEGAYKIDREFLLLKATFADLAVVFKNEWTRALSELDKILGFSATIKKALAGVTLAVRFFGENVAYWAAIIKGEWVVLKYKTKWIFEDIAEIIKSMFGADFDAGGLVDKILGSIRAGYENSKGFVLDLSNKFSVKFGVLDFDTWFSESTTKRVIDKFSSFTKSIEEIFSALYDRLFRRSYFTGFFDAGHLEPGTSINLDPKTFAGHLGRTVSAFVRFSQRVLGVFSGLSTGVGSLWGGMFAMTQEVSAGPAGMPTTVDTPLGKAIKLADTQLDELSAKINGFRTKELSVGPAGMYTETEDTNFGKAINQLVAYQDQLNELLADMSMYTFEGMFNDLTAAVGSANEALSTFSQEWLSLQQGLYTNGGNERSRANDFLPPTKLAEELRQLTESYDKFVADFNASSENLKLPNFEEISTGANSALEAIETSVPYTMVVAAIEFSKESFSGLIPSLKGYFKENEEAMTVAVSALMVGLFNVGKLYSLISKNIGLIFLFAAIFLEDDERFKESLRKTVEAWTNVLIDTFKGDEKGIASRIVGGVVGLIDTVGEGIADALFGGTVFEGKVTDYLTNGVVTAVGLLVLSSKLRNSLIKNGVKIGRGLAGGVGAGLMAGTMLQDFTTGFGLGNADGKDPRKEANRTGNKPRRVVAGNFGIRLGGLFAGLQSRIPSMMAGLIAQGFADAVIPDDFGGGVGEVLDGAIGWAIAGASFGPWGAAIGFLIGAAFDVANNKELRDRIMALQGSLGTSIKDSIVEALELDPDGSVFTQVAWEFQDAMEGAWDKVIDKIKSTRLGRWLFGDDVPAETDVTQPQTDYTESLIEELKNNIAAAEVRGDDAAVANYSKALDREIKALDDLTKALKGPTGERSRSNDFLTPPPDFDSAIRAATHPDNTSAFSHGGSVNGAGTGTSDDIPAMLSNGEFVMKQSAVQKFGTGFMSAINSGKVPEFRAGGGSIGSSFVERQLESNNGELNSYKEMDFDSIMAKTSGFNNSFRQLGYLASVVYKGGNKDISDNYLSYLFNADGIKDRFTNLFSGKATASLYDMLSGSAVDLLEILVMRMGLNAVPGFGTVLSLMPLLEGFVLRPLQGFSRGLRDTGEYSGMNKALSSILKVFEDGHITADLKDVLLAGPRGLLSAVTGIPQYFNSGGSVNGAGTGTSDDIPAMLSNGEYVIQQSAVQKFGTGFLNAVNAGKNPIGRSPGGEIGRSSGGGTVDRLVSLVGEAQIQLDMPALREALSALNEILDLSQTQLDAIEAGEDVSNVVDLDKARRKEQAEGLAEAFIGDINGAIKHAMKTGDIKGALVGLMDSLTNKIIDNFVDNLTDNLFGSFDKDGWFGDGNLFDGLVKMFSGSGDLGAKAAKGIPKAAGESGGFLSGIIDGVKGLFSGGSGGSGGGLISGIGSLFSGLFGGVGSLFGGVGSLFGGLFGKMSQGGTVPSTPFSQVGKDSVPTMLMPGEVVLSKNQVAQMRNEQGGGQQAVYNINVSGDVSRQTRSEIVRMIPQITQGVNMTNKERRMA